MGKRQRAGALQDASRMPGPQRFRASVVEPAWELDISKEGKLALLIKNRGEPDIS